MADCPNFRRIALALFALITWLPPAVRAKELTSNQYGFQLSLPPGYREQRANVVNIIAQYVEPKSDVGGYPITIDVRHTGPSDNAADKTAIYDPPRQKGWTSTLETRRWKDLDLQVVRQEVAVSAAQEYISYTTVFPLTGEGVIVAVQGEKSRENEVVKVFENAVQKFVNLKPYVTVAGNSQSGEASTFVTKILSNVLLPGVTGALILFWIVKVKKARAKDT